MKVPVKFIVSFFVVLIVAVATYAFLPKEDKEGEEGKSSSKNVEYEKLDEVIFDVKTDKIIKDDLIKRINANGSVKANKELDVVSNISGTVQKVNIYEGKYVNKGDLLLKLDDRELQIALREAKDKMIEAKVEYGFLMRESPLDNEAAKKAKEIEDRLEELEREYNAGNVSEEKYISEKDKYSMQLIFTGAKREEMILNKSGYNRAKNQIERAMLNLEYSEIKAPFSGVIADFNLVEGTRITTGEKIFKLLDISKLKIDVGVLENEVGEIEVGNLVNVNINAAVNETFEGKVAYISPFINPETKTCKVTIIMENSGIKIKPGMFAKVNIQSKTYNNRTLIPKDALLVRDKRTLVFVAEGDLAKWKYVKIGEQNDKYIEVLSGVHPGEDIIVEGHYTLAHDANIKIVN